MKIKKLAFIFGSLTTSVGVVLPMVACKYNPLSDSEETELIQNHKASNFVFLQEFNKSINEYLGDNKNIKSFLSGKLIDMPFDKKELTLLKNPIWENISQHNLVNEIMNNANVVSKYVKLIYDWFNVWIHDTKYNQLKFISKIKGNISNIQNIDDNQTKESNVIFQALISLANSSKLKMNLITKFDSNLKNGNFILPKMLNNTIKEIAPIFNMVGLSGDALDLKSINEKLTSIYEKLYIDNSWLKNLIPSFNQLLTDFIWISSNNNIGNNIDMVDKGNTFKYFITIVSRMLLTTKTSSPNVFDVMKNASLFIGEQIYKMIPSDFLSSMSLNGFNKNMITEGMNIFNDIKAEIIKLKENKKNSNSFSIDEYKNQLSWIILSRIMDVSILDINPQIQKSNPILNHKLIISGQTKNYQTLISPSGFITSLDFFKNHLYQLIKLLI